MKISKDSAVAIHYTMLNKCGEVVATSKGGLPKLYLHGHQEIIFGLEQALEGKETGDSFTVQLDPKLAFGEKDPDLVQCFAKDQIPQGQLIEIGAALVAETEEGSIEVRIVSVGEDTVIVDGNHPLAGEQLDISVEVRNVRASSVKERQIGQAIP
ncbi:MAG: peptidylprolyl isomerase [Pseudomonadales bacterium]|nr:peptidylprolyl isomerase [Pseudomonadales bacterium]